MSFGREGDENPLRRSAAWEQYTQMLARVHTPIYLLSCPCVVDLPGPCRPTLGTLCLPFCAFSGRAELGRHVWCCCCWPAVLVNGVLNEDTEM